MRREPLQDLGPWDGHEKVECFSLGFFFFFFLRESSEKSQMEVVLC